MKYFITGGAGFIGSNLIKALQAVDPSPFFVVYDNLSQTGMEYLSEIVDIDQQNEKFIGLPNWDRNTLVVSDIRDGECLVNASIGSDVIIHLAANTGVPRSVLDPILDQTVNVEGTLRVLEAARKNNIKRLVFASSGAPLGEQTPPLHEKILPKPVSPYGASKLAGEAYCSAYFRTFEIETVVLRFSNVYGPNSLHKESVVAKFIKEVMEGEEIEIYGDGNQTRDYIYIDDLTSAIIKAVHIDGIGGEVFQVATNVETSVDSLVRIILCEISKRMSVVSKVVNSPKRLGDVTRNFSDVTKARKILSWKPSVSLEDGIQKTVDYYIEKVNEVT
jgi:UDP-glucose 4-epimerase